MALGKAIKHRAGRAGVDGIDESLIQSAAGETVGASAAAPLRAFELARGERRGGGVSVRILSVGFGASWPGHEFAGAVRADVLHVGCARRAEGAFVGTDHRFAVGSEPIAASLATALHLE